MSKYARYPEYKESGVPWLGEIPSHWQVSRLKNSILSAQNGVWGSEIEGDENDIYCLRVADFDRHNFTIKENNLTFRNIASKDYESRGLKKGDLLLEKSGGGEKQPVGFVVLNTFAKKSVCSNFVARLQLSKNMDSRYWAYFHNVLYSAKVNIRAIKQSTGIQNLDSTLYFNELACYPTLLEQTQIANFLDRELGKIDALIDKQQLLLDKLAEQRSAVITQAVTKGLNPNAEMKDSGVVWLGDVPYNWEVKKIRYLIDKIYTGSTPPTANTEYYDEGDWNWFNPADFKKSLFLSDSKKKLNSLAIIENKVDLIPKNSVLIIGIGATLGKVGLAQVDCSTNQQINSLIINKENSPKFITYALSVQREIMSLISNSATLAIMNQEKTKSIILAVPPLAEQNDIVRYLDQESQKIDQMTETVNRTIERLKEYRSTLITQAVTGKIDVRHHNNNKQDV